MFRCNLVGRSRRLAILQNTSITKKVASNGYKRYIQSHATLRNLNTNIRTARPERPKPTIPYTSHLRHDLLPLTTSASQSDSATNNTVEIEIDGKFYSFSPILLRDLDESAHSIDASTRQKLFSTADIPRNIRARSISKSDEGTLRIQWDNDIPGPGQGQTSSISWEVLRQLANTGSTKSSAITSFDVSDHKRTLWDASTFSSRPNDIEHEAYMTDDGVLFSALQQLHTLGLLFLHNVPGVEESVSAIAERIGPVKTTFYGHTWDVRSVPQAKNVAYTAQDLGFHMDLLYMRQPPHLQFLHCIRSSSAGGASLFSDAFASAADLHAASPNAFDTLARSPVNFHYDHPSSHYYHQARRVFEMSPRSVDVSESVSRRQNESRRVPDETENIADSIEAVSWSPPFQAPFTLGESANADPTSRNPEQNPVAALSAQIEQWHSAASEFSELIHRPDHVYERMMAPGVCVIFDNRRVLHARRAFEVGDIGRERWLRGAYLDKDPYLSRLKVLQYRRSTVDGSS